MRKSGNRERVLLLIYLLALKGGPTFFRFFYENIYTKLIFFKEKTVEEMT